MLKIKQALFLMFGVTSFIIFYIGFLNYVTTDDQLIGKIMLVFSAIVSIGALIGTLYISNNITKPIESLVKRMNEFSQYNKINNNFYNSQGIQELQYLHEKFENMAKSVSKTIEKEKTLNLELKKIDKRKVEFMSMISHELKTPIMPIMGYIKLLKQEMLGKLNQQQIQALDEIYYATTRLEKLIQDVLTAQKIDLEELSISKSTQKISTILNSVSRAYSPICEGLGIKLEKQLSNDQYITTDPDRINQIFSNLISNSLDFLPKHRGQITIGASIDNENIIFFVKDNGKGISSKEQKNIFKKFYQIDTSSKRTKEGSGLGLAICDGIVKKLDGKIWVKSKLGHGSTFYFSIPKKIIKIPIS